MTTTDTPAPLQEIIRRTKASKSTILRVLNGELKGNYARVAKRHEQIRRIADELNYRPSYAGKTVARQKTQTVGLLYPIDDPRLSNNYAASVHHLATALARHGYDLALHAIDRNQPMSSDLLLDRRFDGYVVHDYVPDTIAEAIDRAKLPCVAINAGRRDDMVCIDIDNEANAAAMVDYLRSHGHQRIAWVRPDRGVDPAMPHPSVAKREVGYRNAVDKAGVPACVFDSTAEAVACVASQPVADRPTALMAYKATRAAELLYALAKAGLTVPNDVSVVSFDDPDFAAISLPPLTVMRVPFDEFGIHAADLVVNAIEDMPGEHLTLPLTLIERESVAQPPPGGA
ncbi:MAG: LacI family DNA-binding transcriptional regulator [Planctomycetota bacterium]